MQARNLILLLCLAVAVLVVAVTIAPSSVPALFREGTTTGPVVSTGPPTPVTPLPADFPGRLNITSTPSGAAVYIDTYPTPSGTTPASFPLSPITHPLMLRHPGYRDYGTSVTIRPGSLVTLSVQMEPLPVSPDPAQGYPP